MTYLSVCSGIEAASVAWHPLGWRAAAFSEIERFPRAVLAQHWPEVPNLGDMTRFSKWPDYAVDILVGGTPCQAFSIAGLRAGLADPRGNLTLTFLAIAQRYLPRWVVWENVPGVFSDKSGGFAALLGGLAKLGYGWAYRVCDAQYFGVAQRRRRVFVIGYLGDWRRAAAVLFERESLCGHPAPRRETGQRVAPTIESRASGGGGGWGTDFLCGGGLAAYGGNNTVGEIDVATGLRAKGGTGNQDFESETFVAVSIQAGALRENPLSGPDGVGVQEAIAYTLEARSEVQAVCFDPTQVTSPENRSNPQPGDPCHPLACKQAPPAVAYRTSPNCGAWETGDRIDALTTGTDPSSHVVAIGFSGRDRGAEPKANRPERPPHAMVEKIGALETVKPWNVAYDLRGREGGAQFEGPHDTANLRAASGGSSRSYVAGVAVRRLTPRECERLQGFPDDYTRIRYGRAEAKDGPRYKALGNSMAVPVMRWLGERIQMVDSL